MKRLFLFAAVAGFALVSAHPPQDRGRGSDRDEDAYPPCSRTVRDNCIQLYEHGVARPAHAGRHRGDGDHDEAAAQGPRHDAHAGDDAHARHGDHCTEAAHHPRGHAYARHASSCAVRCHHPRPRAIAYRVRRAGERG